MKAQLLDLAGILVLLALAIILPVLAGAELERRHFEIEIVHPAISA